MQLLLAFLLFLSLTLPAWSAPCNQVRINNKGSSGASITVDATATGVVVAEANGSRCSLAIRNESANPMRCAPSTGPTALTVTSTVGFLLDNTVALTAEWDGVQEWRCIRTTGSSTTVSVAEGLP